MLSHKEGMVELNKYTYRQPLIRVIHLIGDTITLKLKRYEGVDLGCGPYRLLNKVGLDFNPGMVEAIRARYPNSEIILGDIFNLPFEDEELDSVSLNSVLEHLKPLDKALKEVKRVLRPNGEVIFQIPTEGSLYRLGKSFTTDRFAKKYIEGDYSDFIKEEHVNTCKEVLKTFRQYFKLQVLIGVPFGIPLIEPNILLVGRGVKWHLKR